MPLIGEAASGQRRMQRLPHRALCLAEAKVLPLSAVPHAQILSSASKMQNSKPSAVLRAKKHTCVPKACMEISTTTHVFLTRMARNFRNYHPAHLDKTDHRFAMGGCHGNLPSFSPFLPFSSGRRPSTYYPLLSIENAQLQTLGGSACQKNSPPMSTPSPTVSHRC